jgi:ABC-type polysaccharide/polyol phosphate export permease
MPANPLAQPKQPRSTPRPGPPTRHDGPKAPVIGALARLYWMLLGNAILALLVLLIAQQGRDRAWATDAIFWAAVVSIVLVRYLDIALLDGATASGEPASLSDWRRYTACLVPLALVVWVLAHAVARIGLF